MKNPHDSVVTTDGKLLTPKKKEVSNKKKLITALKTIYDILDEEDHDDVESLAEIEEVIVSLKSKTRMSAEEGIKLIAWKMRVGSAILSTTKAKFGDTIGTGDRVVYIGGVGISEGLEL